MRVREGNLTLMRSLTKEHQVIDSITSGFGPHLTTLLLAGYEDCETKHSFAIELKTEQDGIALTHWVEVRSDLSSGLPQGKEPLVLLALIASLMRGGKSLGSTLWVPAISVQRILGWEDSAENIGIVNLGLHKYFNLSYVRTDDLGNDGLRSGGCLMGFYRLISSYETSKRGNNSFDLTSMKCHRLVMRKNLLNDLIRGTLFGIDWKSVASLSVAA